jgi:hypothetical protein
VTPLCPKCKSPLHPMEIPKWVLVGADIVVVGILMILLIIVIAVAASLKALSTTARVLDLVLPAILSTILVAVAFLIRQAKRTPPYYCDSCHRRFTWRRIVAMQRIGSGSASPEQRPEHEG